MEEVTIENLQNILFSFVDDGGWNGRPCPTVEQYKTDAYVCYFCSTKMSYPAEEHKPDCPWYRAEQVYGEWCKKKKEEEENKPLEFQVRIGQEQLETITVSPEQIKKILDFIRKRTV